MTNQIFVVGKQFDVPERLKTYIFDRVAALALDFEPMVRYCHVNLREGEPLLEADVVVHCHGHVLKTVHEAESFYKAVDGAIEKMARLLEETREAEGSDLDKEKPEPALGLSDRHERPEHERIGFQLI